MSPLLKDKQWVARNLLGPILTTFSVHLARELVMPMQFSDGRLIPEAVVLFAIAFLLVFVRIVRMMGGMRHLRHWIVAIPIDLGGHLVAHVVAHSVLLR